MRKLALVFVIVASLFSCTKENDLEPKEQMFEVHRMYKVSANQEYLIDVDVIVLKEGCTVEDLDDYKLEMGTDKIRFFRSLNEEVYISEHYPSARYETLKDAFSLSIYEFEDLNRDIEIKWLKDKNRDWTPIKAAITIYIN